MLTQSRPARLRNTLSPCLSSFVPYLFYPIILSIRCARSRPYNHLLGFTRSAMACMSVTLCQSFPLPKRFSFKSLHHLSVHRCVYQQYTVKSVTWYSVTNQRSAPTTTPFIVSGRIEHRRHTSVCCAAERLQPK